ncbi:MAG: DUF5615 family PIN-like protein [bacterium]|nr:DUF5615 family PIN-like protein [bacterium]
MKILIDMNLSPDWVEVFNHEGWQSVHWRDVGNPQATDVEIMAWARTNGSIVFTNDLDFGLLLAMTHECGPSVIQVRTQNVLPATLARRLIKTIQLFEQKLNEGTLITLDERKNRIRVLPIS